MGGCSESKLIILTTHYHIGSGVAKFESILFRTFWCKFLTYMCIGEKSQLL
jgi:hypothetical protein